MLTIAAIVLASTAAVLVAPQWTDEEANAAAYADGVPQYCQESCPEGWVGISGLEHCYRFLGLTRLPMLEADYECRRLGGSLPEASTKQQVALMRDFFINHANFSSDFKGRKGRRNEANVWGFWLGYARQCMEAPTYGHDQRCQKSNFFSVNSPGVPMPDLWRIDTVVDEWNTTQPNDEAGTNIDLEEACVIRKAFMNNLDGLDDAPCTSSHFVMCMRTNLLSLQMRCHNPDLMVAPPYPESGAFDGELQCRP